MQTTTVRAAAPVARSSRSFLAGIIAAIILLAAFFAFRAFSARPALNTLSQSALETQYGLHVNLVAVTAAGGLVDVRFKLVDGAKAQSLLQDPANFPTLQVAGVTLSVPEEGRPAEIQYEDDANLFLLYPNAGDVVKPGTPVTIAFGDLQVEPIVAK